MTDFNLEDFVRRAEELYVTKFQSILEPAHLDDFVAIDPETGDYFLGKTFSEANQAARRQKPGRLTHVMRVGRRAALFIGTLSQ